jgi:hypothetical protein
MIIRLHGGIDLTPETQAEGEAMALLIRNARVLDAEEFAKEGIRKWLAKGCPGVDVSDEERSLLSNELDKHVE